MTSTNVNYIYVGFLAFLLVIAGVAEYVHFIPAGTFSYLFFLVAGMFVPSPIIHSEKVEK